MEYSFKRAKPLCLSKKNMYRNILTVRIQKDNTAQDGNILKSNSSKYPVVMEGKTKKTRYWIEL